MEIFKKSFQGKSEVVWEVYTVQTWLRASSVTVDVLDSSLKWWIWTDGGTLKAKAQKPPKKQNKTSKQKKPLKKPLRNSDYPFQKLDPKFKQRINLNSLMFCPIDDEIFILNQSHIIYRMFYLHS